MEKKEQHLRNAIIVFLNAQEKLNGCLIKKPLISFFEKDNSFSLPLNGGENVVMFLRGINTDIGENIINLKNAFSVFFEKNKSRNIKVKELNEKIGDLNASINIDEFCVFISNLKM